MTVPTVLFAFFAMTHVFASTRALHVTGGDDLVIFAVLAFYDESSTYSELSMVERVLVVGNARREKQSGFAFLIRN